MTNFSKLRDSLRITVVLKLSKVVTQPAIIVKISMLIRTHANEK